jgi:threonine dehydratase
LPEEELSRRNVLDASHMIYDHCIRTPLYYDYYLSSRTRADVYLKMETFQPVRSFKIRGTANKMLRAREEGVITASSGNHGMAVAYMARRLNKKATIVLPENVNRSKLNIISSLGAEVVFCGTGSDERMAKAREISSRQGLRMIPPFDDPEIIAGQGTIGLELQSSQRCDFVLSPVGGGGLISGIALSYDGVPGTEVIGAQSENSRSMYESLKRGKPVASPSATVADGIAVSTPGNLNVSVLSKRVKRIFLVSDDEILSAVREMWINSRILMEPASASTVAALLRYRTSLPEHASIALVISGGNVSDSVVQMLGGK